MLFLISGKIEVFEHDMSSLAVITVAIATSQKNIQIDQSKTEYFLIELVLMWILRNFFHIL